jgi:hypothetical protein
MAIATESMTLLKKQLRLVRDLKEGGTQ